MSLPAALRPRPEEVYGHTALRGLAALSVVGYHGLLIATTGAQGAGPVSNFFLHSFIFVDLFFMLSGFIMVEAYGQRLSGPGLRLANVQQYWYRRAAKILPNYYVWLGVAVAVTLARDAYFGSELVLAGRLYSI